MADGCHLKKDKLLYLSNGLTNLDKVLHANALENLHGGSKVGKPFRKWRMDGRLELGSLIQHTYAVRVCSICKTVHTIFNVFFQIQKT